MMKIIRAKNTHFFSWIMLLVVAGGLVAIKSFSVFHNKLEKHESEYSLKTFRLEENEWGYYIMEDGKIMIKQDVIPAVSQNVAFHSEDDANKTANLVIFKLKNGNHPTITIQELEQMKIDY